MNLTKAVLKIRIMSVSFVMSIILESDKETSFSKSEKEFFTKTHDFKRDYWRKIDKQRI